MHALQDDTFRRIAQLMQSAVGLTLAASKKALVSSRLGPRIQRLQLGGFDEYLALISGAGDGGEFQVAIDLLTTNETYFFREPAHFELLERELSRQRPRSLALWSAACSFGDEAYSAAMILSDLQQLGRIGDDWSILATDISDRVLRSAIGGIFPGERLRNVTPERLRRYCLRGEGQAEGLIQIGERVRERVRFGQLNLCRPFEDLGLFDVVLLRNVLIYFDAPTKRAVVESVLKCLRPGGLFFIGTAEGRVSADGSLQTLIPGAFRKVAA